MTVTVREKKADSDEQDEKPENEKSENEEAKDKTRKLKGITWELDPEQSDYPEFKSGTSLKEYFSEFDEDGNPIETDEETWEGYEEANAPYIGAAYVYRVVLPEEDEDGNVIEYSSEEIPEICVVIGNMTAEPMEALELTDEVPEYTVQYERVDRYPNFNVFTIKGGQLGTEIIYNNEDAALNDAIKDCKKNYNTEGKIKLNIDGSAGGSCSFTIKESCTIVLEGNYVRDRGTLFTIGAKDIEVTIENYAKIGAGTFFSNNYSDSSKVIFTNPGKEKIKAGIVVGKNDEVNLDGTTITCNDGNALEVNGNYEMTGGRVDGRVSIGSSATCKLHSVIVNGAITGDANGSGKLIIDTQSEDYTQSELKNYIYMVPDVEIHNSSVNVENSSESGYESAIYMPENGKLLIDNSTVAITCNGGAAAYGIFGQDNCKVTLKGNVDISATSSGNGKAAASMLYTAGTKTVDATELTGLSNPFTIAVTTTDLNKMSSYFKWIEGSNTSIDAISESTTFQLLSSLGYKESSELSDKYMVCKSGNYICVKDKTAGTIEITSGEITEVSVVQSEVLDDKVNIAYEVRYGEEADETSEEKTLTISKDSLNDVLSEILNVDTTPGYTLTFGSGSQAYSGKVTVDTGDGATIVLKGKLEGRCSILGTGTLESYMDAAGFDGDTAGMIKILGGSVSSTSGSTINLSKANLEVGQEAEIKDNSTTSEPHYAIKALGNVQIHIDGGTIVSDNSAAIYQDRASDNAYCAEVYVKGGEISGGTYGISRNGSSKTEISGGTISGQVADLCFRAKESGVDGKVKVTGELPFQTIELAQKQNMNMDLTEAKVGSDKNLTIALPADNDGNPILLGTVTKSGHRDILDYVKLSASGAICVVDNKTAAEADADLYIYWQRTNTISTVEYYKSFADSTTTAAPIYKQYIKKNGHPSNVVIDRMTNTEWKNNKGKIITTDDTVNDSTLKLYPAYNIEIDSAVDSDSLTYSSASIVGKTNGTVVYYISNESFDATGTAKELENTVKNKKNTTEAGSVSVTDGKFSISFTDLEPCTEYTYYLAAKNDNGDYSSVYKVTFKTTIRTLTKEDFTYTNVLETTYDGKAYPETFKISPNTENANGKLFEVDSIRFKKKLADGTYAADFESDRPINAGTYGVYVTTKYENTGIQHAENLLIVDITIKKAKLSDNANWFSVPDAIDYGNDGENAIRPTLKEESSTISGYGALGFDLYMTSALTEKATKNSDGHYDAAVDPTSSYGRYSIGITCTGGENVEAQNSPVYLGEIRINRLENQVKVTCADISYGNLPQPQIEATDTSGEVTYLYSQSENGNYAPWNQQNQVGTWYVKAKIGTSTNYKEAESEPVAFKVTKSRLIPSISSLDSKTYDGDTKASGTLTLTPQSGYAIPDGDEESVLAADAVTGTFEWASKNAGTTGINVYNISLNQTLTGNYELVQDNLSAETFGDSKIEKANLTVTAKDQEITAGTENPEYAVTYSGFLNEEAEGVLDGTLEFDCEYTAKSPAGTYAIVPSGLTSDNYEIQFVGGVLTVKEKTGSTEGSDSSKDTDSSTGDSGSADSGSSSGSSAGGTDSSTSDGSGNSDSSNPSDSDSNSSGSSSSGNSGSSGKGSGSSKSSGSSSSTSSSGPSVKGNWHQDEIGWRFTYANGSRAAGSLVKDASGNQREVFTWVKINGNWWAFGVDGYIKIGWAQDGKDDNWYQIDQNTGMKTGWYFDESGDKHWYYLNPVSGEMVTGWRQIDGKWYYFSEVTGEPKGSMYQNAQTPDGYRVGPDGAWDGQATLR